MQHKTLCSSLASPTLLKLSEASLGVPNTGLRNDVKSNLWKLSLKCTQHSHAYLAYICMHPLKPSRNRDDELGKCE